MKRRYGEKKLVVGRKGKGRVRDGAEKRKRRTLLCVKLWKMQRRGRTGSRPKEEKKLKRNKEKKRREI